MVLIVRLKIPLVVLFRGTDIFDNFILDGEPFAKDLRRLESCVLFNNSLFGKIISSLESLTTFDESFKATSVPFFIPDFNL